MLRIALVAQLAAPNLGWVRTACPAGQDTVRLQCGWVEVAEDRSRSGGRRIRLFVMRKEPPAGSAGREASRLCSSTGVPAGPRLQTRGGPSSRWVPSRPRIPWFRGSAWYRHIGPARLRPLARAEDFGSTLSDRCGDTVQGRARRTAALERYGTEDAVMDLEAVRHALGIEQLNCTVSPMARGWPSVTPCCSQCGSGAWCCILPGIFAGPPDVAREASRRVFARAVPGQPAGFADAVLRRLRERTSRCRVHQVVPDRYRAGRSQGWSLARLGSAV